MICSRCQANVDGGDYPHWQNVCRPCKATLDAREEADRLEKENRELRTKQQLSVSSNWGIECSRSVAEIENEELRAQLAAANSMLGTWEAITRKTAEKDGVQYVGPNTASAISDVATGRAEKAESELKAANERAEKAEALADHQATGVDRLSALNDALAARVAELEGALGEAKTWLDLAGNWGARDACRLALARTPAQSLARVQAAALIMAAEHCEESEVLMSLPAPGVTIQEQGAIVCLALGQELRIKAAALEAEAANG